MINTLNIECEHLYAVGDIHGYFNEFSFMLKRYDLHNDCIIVCGDCGIGFSLTAAVEKQNMAKLNKVCKERNVHVIMVRGNHDNPAYFKNGMANTKNIIAVPDYTVVNGNILCVGGAISIDRTYRLDAKEVTVRHYMKYHPGVTIEEAWRKTSDNVWPDEAPVYNEEALTDVTSQNLRIEHVITHTAPSFCEPFTKDGLARWASMDEKLLSDVDDERHTMDMIYQKLLSDGHPLKDWTYGHYHKHKSQFYNGVKFTMLDCIGAGTMNPDWIELVDYTKIREEKQ